MAEVSLEDLSGKARYGLLTSVIVPRPIAWVSTLSKPTKANKKGVRNLAPFSFFSGVSSSPPLVSLSIADRPDGRAKDTFQNLSDTGVYCINLVEEAQAASMNISSGSFDPGVDEFVKAGVSSLPCQTIEAVRVGGARVALECKLVDVHVYGGEKGKVRLCIGEVMHAFVDDALYDDDGRIDAERMTPVGRMAGGNYVKLGERFVLKRPR